MAPLNHTACIPAMGSVKTQLNWGYVAINSVFLDPGDADMHEYGATGYNEPRARAGIVEGVGRRKTPLPH